MARSRGHAWDCASTSASMNQPFQCSGCNPARMSGIDHRQIMRSWSSPGLELDCICSKQQFGLRLVRRAQWSVKTACECSGRTMICCTAHQICQKGRLWVNPCMLQKSDEACSSVEAHLRGAQQAKDSRRHNSDAKYCALVKALHEDLSCDWSRNSQQAQRIDMQAGIYYLQAGQCCQLHAWPQPRAQRAHTEQPVFAHCLESKFVKIHLDTSVDAHSSIHSTLVGSRIAGNRVACSARCSTRNATRSTVRLLRGTVARSVFWACFEATWRQHCCS